MTPATRPTSQVILGTAHLTLSALAAASAIALLAIWPGDLDRKSLEAVEIPAAFLHSTGLLYLLATAGVDLRLGLSLRRTGAAAYGSASDGLWGWLLACHLLVLTAALLAAVRGSTSRTLLAELHYLVAVLITTGSLSAALLLLLRWTAAQAESLPESLEAPPPSRNEQGARIARLLCAALVAAGVLLIASLALTETRRLPPNEKIRHLRVTA